MGPFIQQPPQSTLKYKTSYCKFYAKGKCYFSQVIANQDKAVHSLITNPRKDRRAISQNNKQWQIKVCTTTLITTPIISTNCLMKCQQQWLSTQCTLPLKSKRKEGRSKNLSRSNKLKVIISKKWDKISVKILVKILSKTQPINNDKLI